MQRNADSRVTTKTLLAKLESQGHRCSLTGWELTPETAGVDHTVPISQGGKHELSNIAIVDSRVNRAKHTMPLDEFVEMCTAVADWNRKKLEQSSQATHETRTATAVPAKRGVSPMHAALHALNTATAADRAAMQSLIETRVPCNEALGYHPTVQVGQESDGLRLGALGLINGIIEPLCLSSGEDQCRVAAQYDDGAQLLGFVPYQEPAEPTLRQKQDAASQGAEAVVIDGDVYYRKLERE